MDVTTATETLASLPLLEPPQPTLPLDLIPEILCRLPVKLLLQLKCVCKSWKSLISDPNFAKKHLRVSKTYHNYHHIIVRNRQSSLLRDFTLSSIFSDAPTTNSAVPQLQLIRPEAISGKCVSSCDGILLFTTYRCEALLWNPSIRKFKILPLLWNPQPIDIEEFTFGNPEPMDFEYSLPSVKYTIGYDHFIDNYKVFAVTSFTCNVRVHVYTLGADSDSWRSIDDFPNRGPIYGPGVFVSGSVNWLAVNSQLNYSRFIVSLDLEKESYRKLLMPDLETSLVGVLRDCLCLFVNNVRVRVFDVWVMKEYGIEDSWTKLFSVPYMRGGYFYMKLVYIEDDQLLLEFFEPLVDLKLAVYNSRNGTFKNPKFQIINDWMDPKVYVESLISPCS